MDTRRDTKEIMIRSKYPIGRMCSTKSGWQRISVWQCSWMLLSTIAIPIYSFQPSSSISPSLLHHSRSLSVGQFTSDRRTREYININYGLPLRHSSMQYQSKLWMSTSITSGGWNTSESSTWDDSDEGEEDEDPQDEDDDGNEFTELLVEHETWSKAVGSAIKALGKKRTSLQSELRKAEAVESTVARAQLLVSNLYLFTEGVKTATVNDWENDGKEVELTLDPNYDSASAEADALFALVRKLKRGSQIIADLLKETDAAWDILSEAELDLQSARSEDSENVDEGRLEIVKERLIRTSRTTKFQAPSADDGNQKSKSKGGNQTGKYKRKPEMGTPASNVRKLMSPGGCIVLVGRNRRGNEYLSMSVARGNDIWMHSRGCPGAHVIIQNRRGSPPPTDACLQFGADLAIFYSDLRNEEKADVTAAEPKHIQKPRGAPLGAVKLREEWKTFVGRPGQVPDELKEAREESGQTDEYHMFDKAKHRRRTKQVAEEDRAKRKQKKKNQR